MDATAQELVARLRRNPDDSEAFAALRAHYQRVSDFASLANLLEGWAGRAKDPRAGARALYDAGELVLGALADRDRAIRMYEQALATDPKQQDSFLRLRSLFEEAGDTRRLAQLIERHAIALRKAGVDLRDVALLYHQLGDIWERGFSRPDTAIKHYRTAFELDPTLVAAIYAAREIYRAAGNVEASAALLEKEAKAELDPQRTVALWRELAHVRSETLGDAEGAALALKRALAKAPNDLDTMGDLAHVYLSRAESSKDAHVAASDRHRAADLLYQMAQKVAPDAAMGHLEQALEARADHDGAMSLYERKCEELGLETNLPARWVAFLAQAPARPEAAYRRKRLAQAYVEAGQVEYAITCLEWLLDEDDAEAAEQLVDLYREAGREGDVMRALGVAARGLPPEKRVPRLRELVERLRDAGELERAATFAAEILTLEPGDVEALHLLERACQKSGEYRPYRDALLAASRIRGANAEDRKKRLQEVARISEERLDDREGAISAWRGVAALDLADRDARAALKRLFTETQRWDDLVDALEREALAVTEVEPKAEIFRELAMVHRDRRSDLASAIDALRHLRDLLPGDVSARDTLSDALLQAGAYLEAVPLLRQRVQVASGPARVELLQLLASTLQDRVGDEEGAFECWAQLLDETPTDLDTLARMEAIDAASGAHERLLSTLSYKAEVIEAAERPAVFGHMARIADEGLMDLERAAELYARALELAPGDLAVLDALFGVYQRAGRYKDLVTLLRETALREENARRRAELYRRIARTLADPVGNEDGAAEAWREVLLAGEDEEALRALRRHATRGDDVKGLEALLARLGALVADDGERRDLHWERALLLADRLDRPAEAIEALRSVIALQADHVAALSRLASLSEGMGDVSGLADALWRQLAVLEEPDQRKPLAKRLADLHQGELPDADKAASALDAWAEADPWESEPLERLAPVLEGLARWPAYTSALDTLAGLVGDEARTSELVRRSAEVAYRQLGDVDGAWCRLEPRIREEGDAAAEADLRELARAAAQGERLAELYVSLAQQAEEPTAAVARWMNAGEAYESYLNDRKRALEAVLRALAADFGNVEALDAADRLAAEAGAWERLGQVYETLIRKASTPDDKIRYLLRHADQLLASDASAALDQTLRACSLAPLDDAVLALAEERAPRAGRADELLVTYDKRKASAPDDAGRVEALLRSARWSEATLRDRERCAHYLTLAVALTARSPDLAPTVEALAGQLDAAQLGTTQGAAGGVQDTLVRIYARIADDMEADPRGGALLLVRAAGLLHQALRRDADALAALKRAAAFAPSESEILDELDRFARRVDRVGEFDEHLAHLIEEAIENRTAAGLLARRGDLLEELGRWSEAAEVWSRLSSVTSGDRMARERLRACLREAGKVEDLLLALGQDLRKTEDPGNRLAIRREIARVWDQELANRWEAVDAWKKVLKDAPGDDEATRALERLESGKRRSEDDSDLAVTAPRPEAFADVTEEAHSSETFLDSDLGRELREELPVNATRNVRPPASDRATRQLDSGSTQPDDPDTAQIDTAKLAAPPALETFPEPDSEDDYTMVAEDVFGQLRPAPSPLEESAEWLGTGEVELLDELDSGVEEIPDLQSVEELDVDELSGLVALEESDVHSLDDLEEIEDLEEID